MTRTYLVALEVDAMELDADVSIEILDAVESTGRDVASVKPWSSPGSGGATKMAATPTGITPADSLL